jgi:RNA polymerase sigma-70 factor, ECF subfamily
VKTAAKLRAIALGDRGAYTALFQEHMPRYIAFATGLLAGDKHAAEDVVHEAFVAIWQQAASFNGAGSAEGWMRRIVRNKAVDYCRKQREIPMTDDLEASYADQVAQNDPFELTAQSGVAQQLRAALSILSVEQREAVWLCYFEEFSLSEISEITHCPENTVKTRLFNARKILRNSKLLQASALV